MVENAKLPCAEVPGAVLQFVYPLAAVLFDWRIYGTTLGAVKLVGILLTGFDVSTIR